MIRLTAGAVLRQAGSVIEQKYPEKTADLPKFVSCVDAVDAAASVIRDVDSKVLLTRPRSQEERAIFRQIALENVRNETASGPIGLPIRVRYDVSTLPSPVIDRMTREKLKENLPPADDKDPYPITIRAGLLDGCLPIITANLKVMLVDYETESESLDCTAMLWDTGARRTIITEELLSPYFRARLQEPPNEPYRSENGAAVQVSAVVAFSNTPVEVSAIALVRPRDQMPNRYLGVIFGQQQCIDSISHVCMPRNILVARGEAVGDGVWGDIILNEYVDIWGDIQTF